MFYFDDIVSIVPGEVLANNHKGGIEHFLTDSRRVYHAQVAIFLAINGERHNGHEFLLQLFDLGVRSFIVEDEVQLEASILDTSNVLKVPSSIEALQIIAAHHRTQFHYPVVGITGSNGKTIVKEWLGQMLGEHFLLIKSPKSYNSQLGVPLSVLQMTNQHNLAVFEAGISKIGEMHKLQELVAPDYGVFTNIGPAHDEGFTDHEQKASEKWLLFKGCQMVTYCIDHEIVHRTKPKGVPSFTWGKNPDATVRLLSIDKSAKSSRIQLEYLQSQLGFRIPFVDDASIENVMHCIAFMLFLKIEPSAIEAALATLHDVEMRLELKKGINNCYLIDDTYNNDLGGLQVALAFLKGQVGEKKRIILSDIFQSGLGEKELCLKLNQMLEEHNLDALIGIGDTLMRNHSLFTLQSEFYSTTDQFLAETNLARFQSETILIKGARKFGFERIINAMSAKVHRTVLEINLDALNHNLNFYRSKLQEGVKLMVMVKAAAYGSGSIEIANLLEFNRVDYLAVAYVDEGVELRKQGIRLPIMVMNVVPESFESIVKYDLEPEIYSPGQLQKLISFLGDQDIKVKIHLKIDTGMHRLGFEQEHIKELISTIRSSSNVSVASIYSHLAGADEERHNVFSRDQVKSFLSVAKEIKGGLETNALKHVLNSAGIMRFPEFQMDMVRLGIGLYGYEANQQEQGMLHPISTLKTIISQVREVKKGATIGYARKGVVERDSKIATIAIGYADGFLRAFGNGKTSLLVNGSFAPVIGNVCMDMCMLDVTGIDAAEGDEVIVFGEEPSIKQLADAIGTIPYEILTNISNRVTRVFYTN